MSIDLTRIADALERIAEALTATPGTTITCDAPGCEMSLRARNITVATKLAEAQGWAVSIPDGQALCPNHYAELEIPLAQQ